MCPGRAGVPAGGPGRGGRRAVSAGASRCPRAAIARRGARVRGPVFRLFRIGTFYTHDAIRQDGPAGSIGDITFRNVTVDRAPIRSIEDMKAKVDPANRAKIIFR